MIFLSFQFLNILEYPEDCWTNILQKIADDTVYRIFDYLPRLENSEKMDKSVLLTCFTNGNSKPNIKSRKGNPGRKILIKNSDKPILTSEIFENPLMVYKRSDGQMLTNSGELEIEEKYLYRYAFPHEIESCLHKVETKKEVSRYDLFDKLLKMKTDTLYMDLVAKYESTEEKMIKTITTKVAEVTEALQGGFQKINMSNIHSKEHLEELIDEMKKNLSNQLDQMSQKINLVTYRG